MPSSDLKTSEVTGYSIAIIVNIGDDELIDRVGKKIKNLSIDANLAKFKKSNLTKSKKSNFVKANSSNTDFLTSEVKKVFTHLQKTFTKDLILYYFKLERHI